MRKINRRNFLKVTGVLAAAPLVPLPAQTVQRLTMS